MYKNRLLDSVGEGEGGMFQENSIETCILSRVKQISKVSFRQLFLIMSKVSFESWSLA